MTSPEIAWRESDAQSLTIEVKGDWLLRAGIPAVDVVLERLESAPAPSSLRFDARQLGDWDTALLAALVAILRRAHALDVEVEAGGLPEPTQRLLSLAFAGREPEGARRRVEKTPFLARVGNLATGVVRSATTLFEFTGEVTLSIGRFATGRATYLRRDVFQYLQEAGAEALPITSLITFLIGMIFAFVGVMQLEPFGVGIYTADLVAIAMVREMSPIMTAILMAGRTGASYAAQIGTMKVNEEIDALSTLGLNPVDFLVTPRVFALVLMLPLLAMYGSLMGILGGMVVGLAMLDVSLVQYVEQTIESVELHQLWGGLFKALVFGALVAMAGCQQGMACGGSALAVGQATTRAVVASIVLIVVSASVLTVIYINLGI
jgi:phospholipid/cholesterol/gamma-HCH transport system permease protein